MKFKGIKTGDKVLQSKRVGSILSVLRRSFKVPVSVVSVNKTTFTLENGYRVSKESGKVWGRSEVVYSTKAYENEEGLMLEYKEWYDGYNNAMRKISDVAEELPSTITIEQLKEVNRLVGEIEAIIQTAKS